jgi:hypothetical protein
MNRYETSTPRVTLGFAAVAMTAMTLAALVLLPAGLRVYDDPTSTLSGIVTAASAAVQTGADETSLDSAATPVSTSVRCTMVERDRAQEL